MKKIKEDKSRELVLLEILEKIVSGKVKLDKSLGICNGIRKEVNINYPETENFTTNELCTLMMGWDEHSGDFMYPIPVTNKKNRSSFQQYYNTSNLWVGKQKALRIELCNYMIEKLKKQLEEKEAKDE